jgi:hypothetical protein
MFALTDLKESRSVGFEEGRLGVRYCPPGHLTAVSAAEGEAAEIAGKQT